jgi:GT2 family glycosyltransferase
MTRSASIVMLAWNAWALTRRALDTLLATTLDDVEIIVVDNGSTDDTPQALAGYADRVRIVRLPENVGFVRGNNAGIEAADPASDIVLVNNDLEFTQADWLVRLRRCAHADDRVGIVGCRLVDGDGALLHAGTRVHADGAGVQIASGRVERDVGQYAGGDRVVQGVVFAVAYLRREVVDAIGALNEDYHTYAEDSDYCLRAQAAGFLTVLCGAVTLVHRQHGSTGDDRAWREHLLAAGRTVFLRHWRAALEGAYAHRLVVESAWDFPSDVAAVARPLARALDEAGIDVRYRSLYRHVLPRALAESGDSRDHVLNTLRTRVVPAAPRMVLALGDPQLWRGLAGDRRIGWAAFERAPDAATVAGCNAVDEVWAPTQVACDRLVAAGVEVPVAVMPWGVDPDYCHPQLAAPKNPLGEFVYLVVASWDDVDRPWRVLRAFSRAFTQAEAVRLVAWIDPAGTDLAAATRALGLDPHGGRISVLVQRRVPEEERALIFRGADALVATARERPSLDAAAAGLPVVAADDAAHLIERLRATWLDRATAVRDALAASARVRHERSWAAVAARVRERLAAIERELPMAPRRPVPRRGMGGVVVLGMHRSGTSCVAGLLTLMGCHGGDEAGFLDNPEENPRGFFERGDLHAACVEALAARGGDWSIPLGLDDVAQPAARAIVRGAFAAVRAELDARAPWFVKEPRLCLLWPDLADLAPDAVIVHVSRAPGAVAESIAARDGLTVPHALALWEHYNLAALRAGAAHRRALVDYHALLADPVAVARRLYESLVDAGVVGLRLPSATEIVAWVSPRLARRRLARQPALVAEQARLADALADGSALCDAVPAASAESVALLTTLAAEHRDTLRQQRKEKARKS